MKLDGLALKDRTVRDYKRAAERAGLPVDMGAIERVAAEDCATYDAVMRNATPTAPAKPDPEKEAAHAAELDRQAAAVGGTIDHGDIVYEKRTIAALHNRPLPDSRLAHASGRVLRILQGATPSKDFRIACSTCECPDLAYELLRLIAQIVTRLQPQRPRDEPNPFHGLSEIDASRLYQRRVEDICDRSTGKLGPWWVPGKHYARTGYGA